MREWLFGRPGILVRLIPDRKCRRTMSRTTFLFAVVDMGLFSLEDSTTSQKNDSSVELERLGTLKSWESELQ